MCVTDCSSDFKESRRIHDMLTRKFIKKNNLK